MLYSNALRNNKGSPENMSNATKATLKHYCSTVEKPQHDYCTSSLQSWCSFQRDKVTGTNLHKPIKNPLPPAVQKVIETLFERLGKAAFLTDYSNAITSNNNESYLHVLWGLAPKEQYTSLQNVSFTVHLSVCLCNSGFFMAIFKIDG